MGGLRIVVLLSAVLFCLVGSAVAAADSDDAATSFGDLRNGGWAVDLEASYHGKYIWRGLNLVDRSVLQPSATVSREGWSLNWWANLDLSDVNGQGMNLTEIDLTLDYSWACGGVDLSAGAIYYTFPHASAGLSTTELYLAASVDAPLTPALTVYHDVDEAGGPYANLSVSHSFKELWSPAADVVVSLQASASASWASGSFSEFYYGPDHSALADGALVLAAPIELGGKWALTPSLNWSVMLDEDIRDALSDDNNFWGGLTVSYSF